MAEPTVGSTYYTTAISNCARCHGNHDRLRFSKLTHPMEAEPGVKAYTYTYWAPCPTNGEPVLMAVMEVGDDEPDPCLPM
jgi:hypothetical protein